MNRPSDPTNLSSLEIRGSAGTVHKYSRMMRNQVEKVKEVYTSNEVTIKMEVQEEVESESRNL